MAALLCVGRSTCIHNIQCVRSLKSATLLNIITVFFFSVHFVWLFPIAAKYSFHPNHYYSTPIHFFTSSSLPLYMLTIDFNFIIETYYNIQYNHANDISSLTLFLSHTLQTPDTPHRTLLSTWSVKVNRIFFLQKKAVVQCIMAKDENRCMFWNDSNDVCVCEREWATPLFAFARILRCAIIVNVCCVFSAFFFPFYTLCFALLCSIEPIS